MRSSASPVSVTKLSKVPHFPCATSWSNDSTSSKHQDSPRTTLKSHRCGPWRTTAGPWGSRSSSFKLFVVFTCAVTRALHLELVSSQGTDDFIQAYRRLAARRGKPRSVLSDNAKNFKGAAKVLAAKGVSWHFIVERASWWGGFWERLVGLTKSALRRTRDSALLGRDVVEGKQN